MTFSRRGRPSRRRGSRIGSVSCFEAAVGALEAVVDADVGGQLGPVGVDRPRPRTPGPGPRDRPAGASTRCVFCGQACCRTD